MTWRPVRRGTFAESLAMSLAKPGKAWQGSMLAYRSVERTCHQEHG
ncbi:MAG: hypothetical protein M3545_13840 [Acidobacteriota bacterium]|nr:hypothetical protein [Acidobacteriota bacterium]